MLSIAFGDFVPDYKTFPFQHTPEGTIKSEGHCRILSCKSIIGLSAVLSSSIFLAGYTYDLIPRYTIVKLDKVLSIEEIF